MGLITGDGGQHSTDPQLRVCLVIAVSTCVYIMFSDFKKILYVAHLALIKVSFSERTGQVSERGFLFHVHVFPSYGCCNRLPQTQ